MLTTPPRLFFVTYIPVIAVLGTLAVASMSLDVSIVEFTRDPNAVSGVHPMVGLLSNAGILLWCATATVCLFAGSVLHRGRPGRLSVFILVSGLLTTLFLLDDLFQFHEDLAERYLGWDEKAVYAFFAAVVIAYLVRFRTCVLRTNYALFVLALAFMAASVAVDTVMGRWLWRLGDWENFVEDGLKFIGIASWLSYFWRLSYISLLGSTSVVFHSRRHYQHHGDAS